MEKITYGAPRLVDWVAQIKIGGGSVSVHFTGGALTSYGVTPAEYTTSNPFIQKVIENSSYFKEGRIIVQRRATIEEPEKSAQKKVDTAQGIVKSEKESEAPENETPIAELTKIDVSCLPDAQAYLQEKFNISTYKIRSCETAQRIAAEHGIQFTGGKFDALSGIKGEAEEE